VISQLPIVAYIPPSYENKEYILRSFVAHDTRNSTAHPLRHAAINLVRQFADFHASKPSITAPLPATETLFENALANGTNYLLTSLTLFTTHEPCLMCSMALLHSRVKEIFYLIPMEKTGGCGGLACLPKLEGVNHRFGILKWTEGAFGAGHLQLDPTIDA
jgi:tRNA-specific adenosine deaminase 3